MDAGLFPRLSRPLKARTKGSNVSIPLLERAAEDSLNLTPPPYGADAGIGTEGDALVQVLADGTDLNAMWAELRTVLATWNTERSAIA